MITDRQIEDDATYWCILKDPKVSGILDQMIAQYDVAKEDIQKDAEEILSECDLNEGTISAAGKGVWKAAKKLFTSKVSKDLGKAAVKDAKMLHKGAVKVVKGAGKSTVVKTGAKVGAGGAAAGWGVKKLGQGIKDGIQAVKDELTNPDGSVNGTGATIAAVAAVAAAMFAIWKVRKPLGDRLSQLKNWFKRGQEVAKCEFNANGSKYEVVFDLDTCKWSLLNSSGMSGKVDDEDVKTYFKTDHFERFSEACYRTMTKYLNHPAFKSISENIKNADVDATVKKFFESIAKKKNALLSGLRTARYNI